MFTQVAVKWLSQQPRLEPLQKQFLEEALRFYQEFAEERGTNPELRLESGNAYRRVGMIQHKLGEFAKAEEASSQASLLLEQLVADLPYEPRYRAALAQSQYNRDYRQPLADSHYAVACVDALYGRNVEAQEGFHRALSIFQKLPTGLKDTVECRVGQATCYQELAFVLAADLHSREAEESARQAVAIQEGVVRESPHEPGYRHGLASSLFWLGFHVRQARPQEAESAVRRALTIEEGLVTDFPAVPDYRLLLAGYRKALGVALKESGRAQEAAALFGEALPIYEKLVADFPAAADYWQELYDMHWRLEQMLLEGGRFQEAEKACREWLALMEKPPAIVRSLPLHRCMLGLNYHRLGEVLCEASRPEEAERAYRQAIAIFSKLAAEFRGANDYSLWLALTLGNLVELYTTYPEANYRNTAEAVNLAKSAVELRPDVRQAWNALGIARYRAGDWQSAVTALAKSVELGKGGYWWDWFFLAMAHWRLDQREEARRWYDRAVDWREKNKAALASNKPYDARYQRYRAEAATLLGSSIK
jgi:tetratricopeptide (TPR) repeat protein